MQREIVSKYNFPKEEVLLNELLRLLDAEGCHLHCRERGDTHEEESPAIRPQDVLFVIDMQNDFLPGGTFGVAEGNSTLPEISRLMCEVFPPTNLVFVTRDYHPIDHCSFNSFGGPFPIHCVQGSEGSHLHPIITDAVRARGKNNSSVVFKGFSEDIDSFGAVAYTEKSADERLCQNPTGLACSSAWTGSFVLKCSNIDADVNAPPDYTAVLYRKDVIDVIKERTAAMLASAKGAELSTAAQGSLSDSRAVTTCTSASATAAPEEGARTKGNGRCDASENDDVRPDAYICGLAFDFCVLDTAVNGRKSGAFRNIYIVVNAARAAHIPGVGKYGSGFLSDPKEIAAKLNNADITLVRL